MGYSDALNIQRPVGEPGQSPDPLNDVFDTLSGDGLNVHECSNCPLDHQLLQRSL